MSLGPEIGPCPSPDISAMGNAESSLIWYMLCFAREDLSLGAAQALLSYTAGDVLKAMPSKDTLRNGSLVMAEQLVRGEAK